MLPLAVAAVSAVAFSPDGSLLAAGGRGVVHLFADGKPVADPAGPRGRVTAVAFGPGVLAVAAGEPGRSGLLKVFDMREPASPKPLGEVAAHNDSIYGLAVSPDGRTLATASYDRTVKLWDNPPTGKPRHVLTDHSDAVHAVAFHPAGKLLATAAADRTVKVWDAATGRRLFTLSEPTDAVHAVAWHPDGVHLLAGGSDKSLRVWAISGQEGRLVRAAFAHEKPVRRLSPSADGKTVWSAGDDGTVKGFDPLTLAERKALPAQPTDVMGFAVHPAGTRAAVGRSDGKLLLVDLAGDDKPGQLLPAPPTLDGLSVEAVARGGTTRATVRGRNLGGVTAVADKPGVSLAVETSADGLTLEITAASDAPVGPVNVRLKSAAGQSQPVRVWVDHFPPAAGPVATLPATWAGRLSQTGDADAYRFAAAAGQQVGIVLTGVDGGIDPVVRVTDPAGRVLGEAPGKLGVVCPAAGEYTLTVRDRLYRGGAKATYRLHAGPLPVVAGVFPLGVRRGDRTAVELTGVNLSTPGAVVEVPADAAVGSRVPVPGTDATVVVGEFPGGDALPFTRDDRLDAPGTARVHRFSAKNGLPVVLEVEAARLGSPLDPVIEVQDAGGKPVPRAVLRGLARVSVTLRDHDAGRPGIRLDTWPGFRQDDLLLIGTDLMRIKELPKGPDDDTQLYAVDGVRLGYLGTTPMAHPFGADVYKVAVEPPGTTVRPNGLPVVTLPYHNDDGGPGFGRDSYLLFDPPADGRYQVAVRDANGGGGPLHAYRLTVRPPRPGFTVKVTAPAKRPKGGAGTATVSISRIDGYDGPVRVSGDGAPATVVEAGQYTVAVPVPASAARELKLTATATIGGVEVARTATAELPAVTDPTDLTAATDRPEVVLKPGGETRLTVRVNRLPGFKGRVPVDVRGLPHGVRVQNVGLNGVMLTPGVSEREIVLYAEPWVRPTRVPFAVVAKTESKRAEFAVPVTIQVE